MGYASPYRDDCPIKRRAMAGFLVRKERWTLSGKARAVLALGMLVLFLGALYGAQPFLAITAKTQTRILVVEGWIPAAGLRQAIIEFRRGGYREVVTSGCLTHEDPGERVGDTYADWGAERLYRYGLKELPVTPAPCYTELRDRTYVAALAVKQWLAQNRSEVRAIDVLTSGAHARRSRLLFQKALGDSIRVGIISVPNLEYDPDHWWQSSEGVREVLGEGIAYLYARFFFWPASSASDQCADLRESGRR